MRSLRIPVAVGAAALALFATSACTKDAQSATPTTTTTRDVTTTTATEDTTTTVDPTVVPTIEQGELLFEDPLLTSTKGEWPATTARLSATHDAEGALLSATVSGISVWSPTVEAASARDVIVDTAIVGLSTTLSPFDDSWGVACRVDGDDFYAMALRGGAEDGTEPSSNIFNYGIFKSEGGTVTSLAGGTVELGGSLFQLQGVCVDTPGGTELRLAVAGEEQARAVDTDSLTGNGTGVLFGSDSGTSKLRVRGFSVLAARAS